MIQVSFTTAFMLYLGMTLLAVLGIWIFSHYKTRKRSYYSDEQALFVCEFCHYAYLEDSAQELNRCPQCGLINKKNQYNQSG